MSLAKSGHHNTRQQNTQHLKLQDYRAQMSHNKHFLLAKIWDILTPQSHQILLNVVLYTSCPTPLL